MSKKRTACYVVKSGHDYLELSVDPAFYHQQARATRLALRRQAEELAFDWGHGARVVRLVQRKTNPQQTPPMTSSERGISEGQERISGETSSEDVAGTDASRDSGASRNDARGISRG